MVIAIGETMRILIILAVAIGFYKIIREIYIRNCFKNISAEIDFDKKEIFQGERCKIKISLTNKKLFPLWWILVRYKLSKNLVFVEESNLQKGHDNYRSEGFYLRAYEKVTREYTLLAHRRGYYEIKELELLSGDIFSSTRLIKKYDNEAVLFVYPQQVAIEEIGLLFNKITGELITKKNLIDDPFQLRGIREYSPFDSMKTINWKATAKSGELKVNQFDSTSSAGITILLNVEKYNEFDDMDMIERGISIAASMANEFVKRGMEVEVFSNGRDETTKKALEVNAASYNEKIREVYEALAALNTSKQEFTLADLINNKIAIQKKNRVILLVSHFYSQEAKKAFKLKIEEGYSLIWIVPKIKKERENFDELEEYIVGM
ncbi:hypothetical protein N3C_2747 [Clostridium sp. N3C]|uniref:DUF58 domain-containing protein n=1 Tax=Clostridium sp. N3C TaxID=1776758 RepID=UPI00092E0F97|nr:DUF58 domain-containing protein [Clostridium sp. N3C]SCN26254.1 hypothetical protein N3C_2747 [Clostridium sp. N3C]